MRWMRLALTYSAVATLAAAGYLSTRGELAAPIVLSFLSLGFVGVRAQMDVDVLEAVARVTPQRERLASVAVAGLLVTAALSGSFGAVDTAVAAEAGNCSDLDDFVMFLTLGLVNGEDCTRQAYVDATIEDMQASDANQTEVDIYSAATGQRAQFETRQATLSNYLQDTDSVAWMKVETAVAEAYSEGKSKSQAKVAARQAIADYYAVKQVNMIESHNVTVQGWQSLRDQAIMEDGISSGFVGWEGDGNSCSWNYQGPDTKSVNLVNGSSHDVLGWKFTVNCDGSSTVVVGPNTGSVYADGYQMYAKVTKMIVKAPNSNFDRLTYYNIGESTDEWSSIQSQNDNLQSEAENFVDATWEDYESGQINASDVVSSNTAMFEYGVRSGNESEGLYRSTAALALMGYDTPNLNNSGAMEIQVGESTTYTGLLLANDTPSGSWTVGKTYNTSNFSGPVFIATSDGKKVDIAEKQNFTITSMTAKDGSDIQEIGTKKYRYKTANTSELLEVQRELTALRSEIESREPKVSGGGTGSGGSPLDDLGQPAIIALAAVAAVLVLQSRN